MVSNIIKTYPITTAGATIAIPVTDQNTLYIFTGSGALVGNITIAESGTPQYGMTVPMLWVCNFTLGVQTISIFGKTLTAVQATKPMEITAIYNGSAWSVLLKGLFGIAGIIATADIADDAVTLPKLADITRGSIIVGGTANAPTALDLKTSAQIPIGDGTDLVSVAITGDIGITSGGVTSITALAIVNADINAAAAIAYSKLAALTSGNILVGSAGNVATSVAMSGDTTITNAGVVAIAAGVIVNADVAAGAAIAFSKLAVLTAGNVLMGSAGTVVTSTALSGDITTTSAGVVTIANGAITAAKVATAFKKVTIHIPVSFESGEQCKNTVKFDYSGTIDFMFTSVTKALGGTDTGTITAKIGGTSVTNGVVTIAISAPLDDQDSATPSALNTFAADDAIDFLTAKTTAGGKAILTVYLTRTS